MGTLVSTSRPIVVRIMLSATLALLAPMLAWPAGAAADVMYWTDFIGETIERANVDGTGRITLITGLDNPHGIALDVANNHMYWAEYGSGSIRRADLDGTNIVDIVTGISGNPAGLAIDFVDHKLYWTTAYLYDSAIYRANLDGSDVELVVETTSPRDIFLTATRMYWTDWYEGTLESANLDGTDHKILRTDLLLPYGLEVDVANGLIYWAELERIRRANLDGTDAQDVLATENPVALALDRQSGRLYWSDFAPPPPPFAIYSANIDGTDKVALVPNAGSPYDIALRSGTDTVEILRAEALPFSLLLVSATSSASPNVQLSVALSTCLLDAPTMRWTGRTYLLLRRAQNCGDLVGQTVVVTSSGGGAATATIE